MDYYATLGVDKNASAADIKKAYRKLASKHHPDKGGDADQFKKIQEAYETLGDPQRKSQYDNPHFGSFEQETPFWGDQFDPFNSFARGRRRRNPDGITNLQVSLDTIFKGGDVVVDVGYAREVLYIEPGTQHGTRIRISGKGPGRYKDLPPGDLIVVVEIARPPRIDVDGPHVYQTIDIDALDAITGAEIQLEHFTGNRFTVKIPPGIQPGNRLRLTGQGLPVFRQANRGDLYIIANIVVPKIDSQEHIDKLNIIKQEVKK